MAGVRVVQFLPELCPACAEKAFGALGTLRDKLCPGCRRKISKAAEAFADAVAIENANDPGRSRLPPMPSRGILRKRKGG